ncbi:MAG: hypothetical protein M1812_001669 [Candelaria pacifica]|nr:MAG: hypothetical protein M1812_001669 [Candelaria pacifica]
MPALNIMTDNNASYIHSTPPTSDPEYRSTSPSRPSVSPITPVFSHATLAPPATPANGVTSPQDHVASLATQLPLLPFSDSDNSDAIALRNAISVLQIQKEQSKRDLILLEKIKRAAVSDPETFAQDLNDGKLQGRQYFPLFQDCIPKTRHTDQDPEGGYEESPQDVGTGSPHGVRLTQSTTKFDPIPLPQNVIRCPPINWAKYHVVGESLDKLHQEQVARPIRGEPQRDESFDRAPEHFVAAPYRPLVDKVIDHPMRTRNAGKRK